MTRAGRSPWAAAAALGILLLAAALWALPVWRDLFGRSIGVIGDPSQYIWDLAWFRHALMTGVNPFLTDHMNYPAGINLMWNTSNPAVAIAAAPLTTWLGPVAAYNVLIPLAMALSGWCAYFAARHFGASFAASLAAGLLFQFSPYELAQGRAHLSTVVAGFAPLLAIVLDEALVRQSRPAWRVGLAAGALGAVQLLVLEEYVATGLLVTLLAVLVIRPRPRYTLAAGAVAAATFLALASFPLYVQFFGAHRPAAGTLFHEQGRFVTDLANFVVPTRVELLGVQHVPFTGTLYEFDAYLGLPLLALVGWFAVTHRGDARVRVIGLLTLILALLSLGPALHVYGHRLGIPLPWAPIDRLPLLGNALPARLALYVTTGMVILAALALDALLAAPGRTRLVAAALVALVAISWLPAPPATFPQPVPAFFATAALPAGSVAVLVPWPREGVEQGMVWQAVSGMRFKMLGGYFLYADDHGREYVGSPPTALAREIVSLEDGRPVAPLDARSRAACLAQLRADRVRTVVVAESAPHLDRIRALLDDLLGGPPRESGGVLLWTPPA